jgi:hypothetical protein
MRRRPGATILAGSPADLGKLVTNVTKKWGKAIRTADIIVVYHRPMYPRTAGATMKGRRARICSGGTSFYR